MRGFIYVATRILSLNSYQNLCPNEISFIIALFLLEIIFLKFVKQSKIDFSKFANYSDVSIRFGLQKKDYHQMIFDIVKGKMVLLFRNKQWIVRFDGTDLKSTTQKHGTNQSECYEKFFMDVKEKFGWATAVWEY